MKRGQEEKIEQSRKGVQTNSEDIGRVGRARF